jgi:potassium-transporting ATPase KdpC subunit
MMDLSGVRHLGRPALAMLVVMTVLTGVVYPLAVTGIAQLVFPRQANGSLIERDAVIVGSALIGQPYSDAKYFWGRPSATTPVPYDAAASGGSNLGPTNPALRAVVIARVAALRAADPAAPLEVPVDLVTASASGLDPEISLAAAKYQVARVARARGLKVEQVRAIVVAHMRGRTMGLLGEPCVSALDLNLALDALAR